MSLNDLLREHKDAVKYGTPCKVCTIISELDSEDRKALEAAFLDRSFTRAAITRALLAAGYELAPSTVKRHTDRCVKR